MRDLLRFGLHLYHCGVCRRKHLSGSNPRLLHPQLPHSQERRQGAASSRGRGHRPVNPRRIRQGGWHQICRPRLTETERNYEIHHQRHDTDAQALRCCAYATRRAGEVALSARPREGEGEKARRRVVPHYRIPTRRFAPLRATSRHSAPLRSARRS